VSREGNVWGWKRMADRRQESLGKFHIRVGGVGGGANVQRKEIFSFRPALRGNKNYHYCCRGRVGGTNRRKPPTRTQLGGWPAFWDPETQSWEGMDAVGPDADCGSFCGPAAGDDERERMMPSWKDGAS
jgi:hypothetical protein